MQEWNPAVFDSMQQNKKPQHPLDSTNGWIHNTAAITHTVPATFKQIILGSNLRI